jgi:hypothetical protein
MNSRDLKAMEQAADEKDLERKRREAYRAVLAAEASARAVRNAPALAQEKVREKQLDALALAQEFGALGMEC